MATKTEAASQIRGPMQAEWIERVEEEHNNIHTALEWAISSQKTEPAVRLFAALGWAWEVRAHYNEAYGWLDRIRSLPDLHQYDLIFAGILNHVGRYYWTQNNFGKARLLLEESLALYRALDDKGGLAEGLNALAQLALIQEDVAWATALLSESPGIGYARNVLKKDHYVFVSTYYNGAVQIYDVEALCPLLLPLQGDRDRVF